MTPRPLVAVAQAPHSNAGSGRQAGVITLPVNGDVTATVNSKDADDVLGFGLVSPVRSRVCANCQGGESKDLGTFDVGTTLVFYLNDQSRHKVFRSTDPAHAEVVAVSPLQWTISWDDAGGDGDYNDLITTVVLSRAP